MNDGYVSISAQELLRVSMLCLKQHQEYAGEDDDIREIDGGFIFKKTLKCRVPPRWSYTGVGIQSKLSDFINIAKNKLNDPYALDKDIKLSLTMYSELFKLLNKDKDFQPYVFGR